MQTIKLFGSDKHSSLLLHNKEKVFIRDEEKGFITMFYLCKHKIAFWV